MEFSQYIPHLAQIERKNRLLSYGITTVLLVPFLLLALIWTVHRTHFDNMGEGGETMESFMDMGDPSEMGRPDFGDGNEGNREVNTFDESVANPTPPAPNTAIPSTPVPAPATNTEKGESKDLTSNEDSPVSVPDKAKDTKKDDKTPVTPQTPKPQTPVTPTKPADTKPTNTPATPSTASNTKPSTTPAAPSGGANSGKGGDIGNAGSPDIKHLDPEGMYDFGAGGGGAGGGLKGRKPLALPKPKYDVQQEGKVTFEFVVDPNGEVIYAKAVPPIAKLGLAKAGIEAIKNNWKFSKSKSEENITLRVTITFKLKG